MVWMSAIAAWSALSFWHRRGVPPVLVALLAKMRFAPAKEGGDVAAEKALERDVLVAVNLTGGGEVLIAVQAVDALPRLRSLSLVVCRRALHLAGIARFLAVPADNCVRCRCTPAFRSAAALTRIS